MDSIVTEKIRETSLVTQKDDQLGFYNLAKHLLDYILSKKLPITVGIYGKWGSGKTVLVNYIKDVSKHNEEKIEFINFDAATFRNSGDDLFWYFILKIYEINSKKEWLGWLQNILLSPLLIIIGLIKLVIKLVIKYIINDSSDFVDDIIKSGNLRNNVIRKIANIRNPHKKYFIIIDNLDRLTPQDTITFLEQLKYFLLADSEFNFNNFTFLLLCDFDIISSEIQKIYDNKIDVRDYLNKIIEVPFYLPSFGFSQVTKLTQSLINSEVPKDVTERICNIFETANLNTPRDIKNYLLELDMIFIIAKSRGHSEDCLLKSLDKILAMQIIKTKYFKIYQFLNHEKYELRNTADLLTDKGLIYYYNKYSYPNIANGVKMYLPPAEEDLKNTKTASIVWQLLNISELLIKGKKNATRLSGDTDRIFEIIDTASQNISINISDSVKISDSL